MRLAVFTPVNDDVPLAVNADAVRSVSWEPYIAGGATRIWFSHDHTVVVAHSFGETVARLTYGEEDTP